MGMRLMLAAGVACATLFGAAGAETLDEAVQRGNAEALAKGYKVAVYMAEIYGPNEQFMNGRTVFFSNRGNKQLSQDFVPARFGLQGDGSDAVSYYVDTTRPSADLNVNISTAAIDRSMATWDGLTCSDLSMTKAPSDGRLTGFVAQILGFGGSFAYAADVTHSGWLPAGFFDAIAPNGAASILGVTFTIIWTDSSGNAVDVNNDKKADVAWREIYYNDAFTWRDGARFDVETVSLHEAGHGLSQGHFGDAFVDAGSGQLHFAPRAVMNAAYSGIQRTIDQSDLAGHCSNWANWPQR